MDPDLRRRFKQEIDLVSRLRLELADMSARLAALESAAGARRLHSEKVAAARREAILQERQKGHSTR
jgi:hypothetical protein